MGFLFTGDELVWRRSSHRVNCTHLSQILFYSAFPPPNCVNLGARKDSAPKCGTGTVGGMGYIFKGQASREQDNKVDQRLGFGVGCMFTAWPVVFSIE